MVMGGRETFNMPAILYPGRDNLVRVGRNNARVDEGYNEVLVTNLEEFTLTYGDWLVPMECVVNGEAYLIVRSNAEQPIRLAPGALKVVVRPAVSFPRVLKPSEVLQTKEPSRYGCLAGQTVGASTVSSDTEEGMGGEAEGVTKPPH